MKVKVQFTVDVDFVDEHRGVVANSPEARRIERAVAEAIQNAVSYAQSEGHVHCMSNDISILVDSEITATCVD